MHRSEIYGDDKTTRSLVIDNNNYSVSYASLGLEVIV